MNGVYNMKPSVQKTLVVTDLILILEMCIEIESNLHDCIAVD
jgi:hypothetical protein